MIRGKKDRPKPKIRRTPFIAILLSIIVGSVGISLDEPLRVLEQAKQICLACIGIG